MWSVMGILVGLWLLGLYSGQMLGGFIHVFLMMAIGVLIIRLTRGEPLSQ